MTTAIHALKEWAVATDALERGETIVLLRKGGIREEGKHFRVAHDDVLLYPTYEHQQPHLLKPHYSALVQPVPSGWHPETVRIGAWARIAEYSGCKSWIDLAEPIALEGMTPALSDDEYARQVAAVKAIVENEQLTNV